MEIITNVFHQRNFTCPVVEVDLVEMDHPTQSKGCDIQVEEEEDTNCSILKLNREKYIFQWTISIHELESELVIKREKV